MGADLQEHLIQRAAAGDRAAFDAIVRLCYPSVITFLRRVVGQESEDIAQKSFFQAWRGFASFDSSRPLKPWLFRIALNEARKHYRGTNEPKSERRIVVDPPLPMEITVRDDARHRVREFIMELPRDERALMLLRFQEGFSPSEIAEIEGVSPNAIRVRLSRSVSALRKRLKES